MSDNVTDMKTRAKETTLKSRYRRLQRTGGLSPDHKPPSAGNFTRSTLAPTGSTYLCVEEPPIAGWQLVADFPTHRIFTRPNDLLLYRVLERFFGEADLLGIAVSDYKPGSTSSSALPFTADWGFTFRISEDLVAEVRSLDRNSRNTIRLWASDAAKARANHEQTVANLDRFVADLKNAFENNLHLFEEKQELQRAKAELPQALSRPGVINVSHEKYQAAVRLLEAGAVLKDTNDALELEEPLVREGTSEALLLAAATLFLVSLEAFINLLYALLLRPEFNDQRYERLLTRFDLDLRITSLHLFCRGFVRQPIAPASELWNELNQLREFRNDLVHGNVTDEHRIHAVREELYFFHYAPFRDYRGPAKEKKMRGRIQRYTLNIDGAFVHRVRDVVDRAQEAVLEALEPDLANWARGLREENVLTSPPAN